MCEPDSYWLSDLSKDCHLPETIEVVDGYESLESEELSWSKGDILNLHRVKDLSRIIAQDISGSYFSIPLTYQGKIFERIPKGCKEQYETVGELIDAFPNYVRSLRDIPQGGVDVGDILLLLDASPKNEGCSQLKCRVVGKPCVRFLSCKQAGPFETLEDPYPVSIQEVIDGHHLPACVRVRNGATQAFDGANTSPRVRFEGLFSLEKKVEEKVFVVSTLTGRRLRVLRLPIELGITVKREKSKIKLNLFSQICHLIETKVDLDSTITRGSTGDASWYFDIDDDIEKPRDYTGYEELRPAVPPRSPLKASGSNVRQIPEIKTEPIIEDKGYSRLKPPKKFMFPFALRRNVEPVPPSDTRKQSVIMSKPQENKRPPNSAKFASRLNRESLVEPRRPQEGLSCRKLVDRLKGTQMAQNGKTVCLRPQMKELVRFVYSNQEEVDSNESVYESIPEQAGAVNAETYKQTNVSELSIPKKAILSHPQNRNTVSQDYRTEMTSDEKELTADKFSKLLKRISVSEVSDCLKKLGLSQYVDRFVKEMIDGTMLLELDDEMMQCLGIKNPLHRRKLKMFTQRGWTPKQ